MFPDKYLYGHFLLFWCVELVPKIYPHLSVNPYIILRFRKARLCYMKLLSVLHDFIQTTANFWRIILMAKLILHRDSESIWGEVCYRNTQISVHKVYHALVPRGAASKRQRDWKMLFPRLNPSIRYTYFVILLLLSKCIMYNASLSNIPGWSAQWKTALNSLKRLRT
jgi:hypothetical protein